MVRPPHVARSRCRSFAPDFAAPSDSPGRIASDWPETPRGLIPASILLGPRRAAGTLRAARRSASPNRRLALPGQDRDPGDRCEDAARRRRARRFRASTTAPQGEKWSDWGSFRWFAAGSETAAPTGTY